MQHANDQVARRLIDAPHRRRWKLRREGARWPTFTLQVEILSGDTDRGAEERLAAVLETEGFRRDEIGESGALYRLPRWTFVGPWTDRIAVLQRVKRCLASAGYVGRALVTEAVGRSWSNLDEVEDARAVPPERFTG